MSIPTRSPTSVRCGGLRADGGAKGRRPQSQGRRAGAAQYIEHILFEPIDARPMARSSSMAAYHVHINTEKEEIMFTTRSAIGCGNRRRGWSLQTLCHSRGADCDRIGQSAPDADRLVLTAERGQTDYGICSTSFLEHAFRTDSYRIEVNSRRRVVELCDGQMLGSAGAAEPFAHRDRNTLSGPRSPPNPLARIIAARRRD